MRSGILSGDEADVHWRHRHLLRVGDKVTIHIDEGDHFASSLNLARRYINGAAAEIVGFKVKSVCQSAAKCGRMQSGIYADLEWPCIRVGSHMVQHIRAEYLALPSEVLAERLAASRAATPDSRDLELPFLMELPERAFWEGDVVRIKSWVRQPDKDVPLDTFARHSNALKISWVSWGDLPESVDQYPQYALCDRLHQKFTNKYLEFELDLLERGNCWRQAHGEPLVFADLPEEAVHHWTFSKCETKWLRERDGEAFVRLEDALVHVREGKAHGVFAYDEGWTADDGRRMLTHRLITFADAAFGERVRGATLEDGFLVPCPSDEESSKIL